MQGWIMDELQTADLRDKRLERRLGGLLDSLSQASTLSIPAACCDRAEMVAAYRFFDNEKVDFESVIAPHLDASHQRVAQQNVALLVQDTTELDLTRPSKQVDGSGPLHQGKRCGALLHPLMAFTPDGTPLGTLYAEAWAREPRPSGKRPTTSERQAACHKKPLEQKESYRWLQTAEQCQAIKSHCPETQLVMVADRECDISEVIDFCNEQDDFDWVIRGDASRVLAKPSKKDDSVRVSDQLRMSKVRFKETLSVRSRVAWGSASLKQHPSQTDRDAREIEVTVHASKVALNDPRRGQAKRKTKGLVVNVVLVNEIDPPSGVQAVQWMLITSLPIRSHQQIRTVIDYYQTRWVIELYFKTLKSGCKIESRRFEHIDRYLPALALYMIIAWRSLYACRVSRTHESASCEILYSREEWQSVWQVVNRCQPPRRAPRLMEMTRVVAQLGGYINRKNSGPPGVQSMWLGLQRMHDITTCWLTFGPGAKT